MFDSACRHPYTAVQNSNITRKNVNRETSKLIKRHSVFSRTLSLLLFCFIVYGTTVEAAHSHGSIAGANNASGASTFSDPGTETGNHGNLSGCGDCLICQLHQYFSATLISVPPSIAVPPLSSRIFSLTAVSVSAETNAPRRGRAPPFTL